MKVTTTQVIQLSAKETGDILIKQLIEQRASELGKATSGKAKDLEGLAAEVTLVFESEGIQG